MFQLSHVHFEPNLHAFLMSRQKCNLRFYSIPQFILKSLVICVICCSFILFASDCTCVTNRKCGCMNFGGSGSSVPKPVFLPWVPRCYIAFVPARYQRNAGAQVFCVQASLVLILWIPRMKSGVKLLQRKTEPSTCSTADKVSDHYSADPRT